MKRKSKGLALLLALMMLISMNPAIIFAEDIGQAGDPPAVTDESEVTPEVVYEELGDAVGSELNAAKEFFPEQETWDEVDAAINEAAAANALYDAEKIAEDADEETSEAAADATESKEDAAAAAQRASNSLSNAQKSMQDAMDQRDIAMGDSSKAEADEAASLAKEDAVKAQTAADYAAKHAQDAVDAAADAEAAYNRAQKAYEDAVEKIQAKLNEGLIDAKEAEALTKAAQEKAQAAYDKWEKQKQLADEAVIIAQERADTANAALAEQIELLDAAIEDTTKDVASKTGTAALTGSALAAAKVAVGASMLEVNYYEGRIKVEQATIGELNEKIADAEAKIEAADALLQVKEAALDKAAADYADKKAALEDAEQQLEYAREAVEAVKEIIEERDESGIRAQLSAVRSGEFWAGDVHDVAAYLMKDYPDSDKLEWDALDSDVFSIGDQFYKVSLEDVTDPETGEVIDRILVINEYFPGQEPPEGEAIESTKEIADAWDDATAKENNLVASGAALKGAVSARNIAAVVLGKSELEYKVVDIYDQYQGAKKTVFDKVKSKIVDDVVRLDSKLNLDKWTPTEEQEEEIGTAAAAVLAYGLGSPLTLNGVKAVGKALLDFSIPAKARNIFAKDWLAPISKTVHERAVDNLKTSVEEGSEAIQTAATATAEAGKEAAAANVGLVGATVTKKVVDKKFEDADKKKTAADEAAAKAEQARADYEQLLDVYGPSDANVEEAYDAWQDALDIAKDAAETAGYAQVAADAALQAYQDAQTAADQKNGRTSPGGDPQVDPQGGASGSGAAASGSGYAAASGTSNANTGDHNKTLTWLTVLCTAGIALTKGLVSRLKAQN